MDLTQARPRAPRAALHQFDANETIADVDSSFRQSQGVT